jgi:hypothetical protein
LKPWWHQEITGFDDADQGYRSDELLAGPGTIFLYQGRHSRQQRTSGLSRSIQQEYMLTPLGASAVTERECTRQVAAHGYVCHLIPEGKGYLSYVIALDVTLSPPTCMAHLLTHFLTIPLGQWRAI